MDKDFKELVEKEVLAQRVLDFSIQKVVSVGMFTRQSLKTDGYFDLITNEMCVSLEAEILCQTAHKDEKIVSFRVPSNWWQHLKSSHFPKWFKKRWPVVFKQLSEKVTFEVMDGYPHASVCVPPNMGKTVQIRMIS